MKSIMNKIMPRPPKAKPPVVPMPKMKKVGGKVKEVFITRGNKK